MYSSVESSQAIIDSLTKVLHCQHIAPNNCKDQILTGPGIIKELIALYCDVDETEDIYVHHWKFTNAGAGTRAGEEEGADPRTPVNFRRINSTQFARKSVTKK